MAQPPSTTDAPPAGLAIRRDWRLVWFGIREQVFFLLLVLPAILVIAIFLIFPMWMMFSLSFGSADSIAVDYGFQSFDQYERAISVEAYRNVFANTFFISFQTTIWCLVLGYPVGYVMANASDKTRAVLVALVALTMWTSILIRTFAWRIILGRNGLINETLEWLGLIEEPLSLVFNRTGTLVGMTHILLPLMILPIFAVMRGIPKECMQAAESLGAGPFTAWWRVYLPLSLPGVGAGTLLVFILSIGFFITPALLGGAGDKMISNIIEGQINELNNWEFASALAFLLVAITLALYCIYARFMSFDKLYGSA